MARAPDTDSEHESPHRTVDLAVATVLGCDHASVTVVPYGKIGTPAASDSVELGAYLDAIAVA